MDATLRRAAILQGTDRGAARALARRLTRTDFPSGHTIFAEGQPGDRLYIVVSGKVKITCRAGTGREAVLAVMGPSDMFGELSVFDPGPRTSSAVTLTKVRAMTMDRATFRWWIAEAPQVIGRRKMESVQRADRRRPGLQGPRQNRLTQFNQFNPCQERSHLTVPPFR